MIMFMNFFCFQMSLVADSPPNSSSSDDFANLLAAELDSISSEASPEIEVEDGYELGHDSMEVTSPDVEDDHDYESERVKRRKVEDLEVMDKINETSTSNKCMHPVVIKDICVVCGVHIEEVSGVALGYIHKDLRLSKDELDRVRNLDKNSMRNKKLYLVLDLDHTLLNSTRFRDMTEDEAYLKTNADTLKGSLFRLDYMQMFTKLRPFVYSFLKEANKMFEMYIYTMGEPLYAAEMSRLLDPGGVYFSSRVISQVDCTQKHQKGLDIVLGQESAVIILDDTENVWQRHRENLILMERYHYFASSCQQFGFNCKSLSELKSDESEPDGALATILNVLKQVYSMYFGMELGNTHGDRDVRKILKSIRKEILKGCKIVFSRVFPNKFPPQSHQLWKMAEQLGASCATEVDESVTHVVAMDTGTEKSKWAVKQKTFLVHPGWLEATNYFWHRQPEENFPVSQLKNQESSSAPPSSFDSKI